MRRVLMGILLLLCAPACATMSTGEVNLVRGGAYGKAIFIVKPVVTDQFCAILVDGEDGKDYVDCNTQYLVGCDIDIPQDEPFCRLVREIGSERDSIYPKDRR